MESLNKVEISCFPITSIGTESTRIHTVVEQPLKWTSHNRHSALHFKYS